MEALDKDCLHRFVFENTDVRGELVHLDASWQTIIENKEYPDSIRNLLGEAIAAAVLLTATIKNNASLHLQLQGDGPLSLLLVEVNAQSSLRALARYDGEIPESSFSELVGNARLTFTIEPEGGGERYQGLVAVEQDTLAATLEDYFRRSEQLQTRLWLAADEHTAGGMLLQRLPGASDSEDNWERDVCLGETITRDELLNLSARKVLHRLFHQEDLRLFEPQALSFRCTCSRERIEGMLRGLGYDEVRSVLEECKKVEVNCEFCNTNYQFDRVDVERLFAASDQPDVPETFH